MGVNGTLTIRSSRPDAPFNLTHNGNQVEEKYAMKKVKIAFWIVVFGFVGLVIFQNKEFFMNERSLMIDLGFFKYETPFLANAIFLLPFFS